MVTIPTPAVTPGDKVNMADHRTEHRSEPRLTPKPPVRVLRKRNTIRRVSVNKRRKAWWRLGEVWSTVGLEQLARTRGRGPIRHLARFSHPLSPRLLSAQTLPVRLDQTNLLQTGNRPCRLQDGPVYGLGKVQGESRRLTDGAVDTAEWLTEPM
ncbi:hypothetical protein Bbelb_308150 [Branchiostoma belcheri]|nr:hypothetical protein Bbelb_308150 [Branchiostoma belcheri]